MTLRQHQEPFCLALMYHFNIIFNKILDMKKISLILIALIAFSSCDNILDEELTGDLTADGVFTDEVGIDFALNGAYASLGVFIGNSNSWWAEGNRMDIDNYGYGHVCQWI